MLPLTSKDNEMNPKFLALILSSAVALTACNGGTADKKTAAPSSEPAAASVAAHEQDKVKLLSSDGKISIETSGQFADKLGDEAALPEGVAKEKITLLQKDSVTGTTLTVIDTGTSANPAEYFQKVKAALETDKSLNNLVLGDIAANSMTYGFSQADEQGNILLNERCKIMLHGKDKLYTICASNTEGNQDELAAALKYITTVE